MKEVEFQLDNTAKFYSDIIDIHSDNPPSSVYWGERYYYNLMEEACNASSSDDLQFNSIKALASRVARPLRIVSIGAGECAAEMRVCQALIKANIRDVLFECVDIAEGAIDRAEAVANESKIGKYFRFVRGTYDDLIGSPADVVIANQCLHHFTELETLFDCIKESIGHQGIFLTNDMIGRNGHMLWPEALSIVDRLWEILPDKYKYNNVLSRTEERYSNWDNSKEMNEGIRAQDILPELIKRFKFNTFFAGGNIAMALFGRHFGGNFNPDIEADRYWIDKISRMDQDLIDVGFLKPVLMMACMSNQTESSRVYRHWTPEFCARVDSPLIPAEGQAKFELGRPIAFSERNLGAECLRDGWSSPEQGGVWSNAPESKLIIPLRRAFSGRRLKMNIIGMQYRPEGFEVGEVTININGVHVEKVQFGSHVNGALTSVWIDFEAKGVEVLEIIFSYDRVIIPAEFGLVGERRRLAFRLASVEMFEDKASWRSLFTAGPALRLRKPSVDKSKSKRHSGVGLKPIS